MMGVGAVRSQMPKNGGTNMQSKWMRLWRETVVFYLGGMFYCGVELLWRGWTHGSMFLLGGLCFYLVGGLNRRFRLSVAVGADRTLPHHLR